MTHNDNSVLCATELQVGYNERPVIDALSLEIAPGTITALVGPNGSGKSTLLKTLARMLKPSNGAVHLDGKAISTLPTAAIARELAILPQGPSAPAGLTVRELVEQGRFPHVGALRMLRQQDHATITTALSLTGMTAFAHRPLDGLSGGKRQRAWIALTLAQDTPILLLDDPTTFLDIGHQLEVLDLVRTLNCGQIVADGAPQAVFTPTLLASVFNVHANIVADPASGMPVCLPYATVEV